jgi:2-polyprenyl-3-methyl-5-hydroxy-6-metoxy-1,4-benzoquinol methylase
MAAPRHRVAMILRLLGHADAVADIGCGGGDLLREIRERNPDARLAGVDLSASQIEANREQDDTTEWICADMQQPAPPALRDSFDAVVASEIIEHVDDPLALLRSMRDLVRPGGRLVLTTQSGRVHETERRVGHVRHFTRAEMESMLVDAGWKPVRVWNAGFPFHDLSKWWANRDADASMRRFGTRAYGGRERAICALLRLAFRMNSRTRGAQLYALAEKDSR